MSALRNAGNSCRRRSARHRPHEPPKPVESFDKEHRNKQAQNKHDAVRKSSVADDRWPGIPRMVNRKGEQRGNRRRKSDPDGHSFPVVSAHLGRILTRGAEQANRPHCCHAAIGIRNSTARRCMRFPPSVPYKSVSPPCRSSHSDST